MTELLQNFKEDFLKLVQKDIDDSKIKVVHFKVNEPVSDETIQKIEKKFKFPLNPEIVTFYKQCNGLSYRAYEVKDEIAEKETEKGKTGSDKNISWSKFCDDNSLTWLKDDSTRKNGSIKHIYIRPLEDVLLKKQYLIEEDEEEQENLYLFDAWYYYYPIMLSANKDKKTFEVILGSDYGACYTDYPPISFEKYMQGLLKNSLSQRYFGKKKFTAFNIED